ncbi:hypothetical protein [Amycolatopsis vastitatis]|uniref:Uncharacterized protein n=1 Tax=Amycolatopsis vastitatis TaxID=1905142 RepID=A0A229SWN5_9PSEU|nr:hypothetical protein [Amycolatopsis vastitatis]OXM63557.1 hypothetical protein CF165_30635 [Amycolatopsis vastitatis]
MAEEAGASRSIFRAQALEYHRTGRWAAVLPPSARPRVFRRLWLVLAVLGLLMAALAALPVPVYGTGSAFAVPGRDVGRPAEPVVLVVALPAADLPGLADGAPAVLQQGNVRGTVQQHERVPVAAAELSARYGVTGTGLPDPAAVAVVRLDAGSVRAGDRLPARVRVGSRSVLAGLPLLGKVFR